MMGVKTLLVYGKAGDCMHFCIFAGPCEGRLPTLGWHIVLQTKYLVARIVDVLILHGDFPPPLLSKLQILLFTQLRE
jgi:hypothetical protein